jgi:hypothetical protein
VTISFNSLGDGKLMPRQTNRYREPLPHRQIFEHLEAELGGITHYTEDKIRSCRVQIIVIVGVEAHYFRIERLGFRPCCHPRCYLSCMVCLNI